MQPSQRSNSRLGEQSGKEHETLAQKTGEGLDPLIGKILGGAYAIEQCIGAGGMGKVYRGVQLTLNRSVAIKVIHPHLVHDPSIVARFHAEARAATRLNHPNSVSVIDFGKSEEGLLYLVMEYLEGKDLATLHLEEGPLPFDRIVGILRGVTSVMIEAHALGIVHRDLKPENIFVRRRAHQDEVKVLDFGLAKMHHAPPTQATLRGYICGTPDYMSPEQARGENVDGRSDIYSLGVILFELLTDRLPYHDENPTKVLLRHIRDPVPDPRVVAPWREIPDALAEIAMKALAKRPEDRFQSAKELDSALEQALAALTQAPPLFISCRSCGQLNSSSLRVCKSCGAALTSSIIVPLQRASLPYRISQTRASLFVGRDREIAFLLESLEKGATSSPWIQLVGKPGVGKTRLLEEFKIQAEKRNWLVLKSGPHPSGTKVPYHALRELVAQLYDIATSQLGELEALEVIEDPNAQLGLKALVERDRNIGASPIALVRLLAALLMEGVLTALSRLNHCGVVLLIDDLHRCCNLTVRTIQALSKSSPQGLRIITSSVDPVEVCSSLVLHLEGLSDDEAALLLGDHQPIHPDAPRNSAASYASSSHHLPLAIEQYRALGAKSLDEIKRSPQRLADLVVLRLSQLNPDSLRLLQAIAVLGDRIHIDDLRKLYQAEININHTSNLIKTEWIQASGDELWFQHPLLREVIESNIPSQARKELHREVLLRCRSDAPLEVQAEHAWRAGLAERAIPLLEKSGDLALERGDAEQAQRDYQRALELAHDSWRSEGQELDEKHFIRLSRKLAKALLKNKKPLLAEGIVREALEGLAPQAIERAHLLVDLGRIAREREKKGEAVRLLNQAVEALERNKDLPMLVEGLLELALTLRSLGEKEPARQVAQRALEVAVGSASEPELTVRVALLNAEIAIDERRFEDAEEHLFLGFAVANRANLKVLLSRILALGAEVAEKNGLPQKARRLLEESIALARSSGNIDLAEELEVKSGAWSPDHPLD